jgi:hypothetical protein
MNGNKFATGQILKKPVEVVKGRILAGWAQKSPEPWSGQMWESNITHGSYEGLKLRGASSLSG